MKSIIQKIRIIRYKMLSNICKADGKPVIFQPVLMRGKGIIEYGDNIKLGYRSSPFFYNGYIYLEARTKESYVKIGDNTHINNNTLIISEGAGIEIGSHCLIGTEVNIYDSDFHGIIERNKPANKKVVIGNNVFIGTRAIILKGVVIGDNSTIAAGAVVVSEIPANSVAAGNPAKVIKVLN